VKLVWHASGLMEIDWIRYLLGDIVEEELTDLGFTCFDDNTIHVISNNTSPLPACDEYFRECRARCKRLVLIHVSDEYLSGGYRLYRHFDAVIRHYHTYLVNSPGILVIPLGYANDTRVSNQSADARKYLWSFTGQVKGSRLDMIKALKGIVPSLCVQTPGLGDTSGRRLTKAEYNEVLENTVFSPCPMGNAMVETWRLYESLELGCIPLIERRPTIEYYTNLFGPNPIPIMRDWRSARSYIEANTTASHNLQREIHTWWAAYKATVQEAVRGLVTGPSYQAELQRYGGRLYNRSPTLYSALRLAELLRHQSGVSLRRRLLNPVGPLRRMTSDILQRFSGAT
jgi:hypothetical protein